MMKKLVILIVLTLSLLVSGSRLQTDVGVTPLMQACRQGKLAEVKRLIAQSADVNAVSKIYHRTALIYAVKEALDPAPIVELLLKNGAKLEIKDSQGNTALLQCLLRFQNGTYGERQKLTAESCRKAAIKLVMAGAELNICNLHGDNSLIPASAWFPADFLALLLKGGVDINAKNAYGYTALMQAMRQKNDIAVIKLLLNKGADANARDYSDTPGIFYASDPEAARLLIDRGADLDCRQILSCSVNSGGEFKIGKSRSIIDDLARWADVKLVKHAIDKKCPVTDQTLLNAAVNSKHPEVLSYLIKKRKAVAKHLLGEMLCRASGRMNLKAVKLLIQLGADVNYSNSRGWTPLSNACSRVYYGQAPVESREQLCFDVIDFLLKQGADPNTTYSNGITPLEQVVRGGGSPRIAELLISRGTRLFKKDRKKRTLLHILAADSYFTNKKNTSMLELLLRTRLDVNAESANGSTALLLALGHHQPPEFIRKLLKAGAKVNISNKCGVTPLMLAARHYKVDLVKELVDYGADLDAFDDTGWNALMYAAEYWPRLEGDMVVPQPYQRSRMDPEKTIKYLIEQGVATKIRDKAGNTVLIQASGWAGPDTVELLIDKWGKSAIKKFVNARDARGRSALMMAAAKNRNEQTILALLKAGAECNVAMNEGKFLERDVSRIADGLVSYKRVYKNSAGFGWFDPPLFAAIRKSNPKLVTMMLQYGADPNFQYERECLKYPMDFCRDEKIALILEKAGAENNPRRGYSQPSPTSRVRRMNFSRACEIEDFTKLKARLKGKPPEVRKELASSGIDTAVRCNSLEVVKMLLKNGAKIKKDCIANAAGNADYPNVLKYFLESGICYSSRDGKNALFYASSAGIVNILVKTGVFVNSSDNDGNTPLLYAVTRSMYKNHWRRSEIVEALIKNGADVEMKDQNGSTPLLRGFSSRYSMPDFNTVKVLLENGADVNSQNRQGQTALQFAVKRGDCRLVDLLLKHGANPWQAENYFNTTYPYIRRQLKKAMSSTKYSRKSYVPRKIILPANTAPVI